MICGDFARTFGAKWVSEITPEDVGRLGCRGGLFSHHAQQSSPHPLIRVRVCRGKAVVRDQSGVQRSSGRLSASPSRVTSLPSSRKLFSGRRTKSCCPALPSNFSQTPTVRKWRNCRSRTSTSNAAQLWVDKQEHTTSHRVIQILPNLRAWLLPYRFRTGKVQSVNYQNRWDALRRKVGLFDDWPHDGLRHSFGTWHFAKFQDLGKNGGTDGSQQPDDHAQALRRSRDPSRADEFWSIAPFLTASESAA